ncbi:PHD finger protein MALE STERILITY 1 [Nymphaea thermarum]|nr:PHD finger protein MALE STERILITY 1 [Nymphaea thermarum]
MVHAFLNGWGHHLVCSKKFHFVLPSKQTAPEMEMLVQSDKDSLAHSATSSRERPRSGVGCRATRPLADILELRGHILHGVIHYNGFGHLLCVNGIEGGSDLVCGSQVVGFWDRICTSLKVSGDTGRQISINDTSKKKSMDLRVLHGVAYGQPWFGRWGYKFGRGSFGVNHEMYQKSMETVRSFRLSSVTNSLAVSNYDILTIISKYQKLSGDSLQTLGHLFHYVMELKSCLVHDPVQIEHAVLPMNQCRWSSKRVEMATLVIIESLKNSGSKWVSRQQVRDSARAYIGDTGLLDFVLKSLGNQVIGNYVVRRAVNPVTRVLEYCLEEANNCFNNSDSMSPNAKKVSSKSQLGLTHLQLVRDLLYLYSTILRQFRPVCGLTRAILDAKHLIKDYSEESLRVECQKRDKLTFLCALSVSRDEKQVEDEWSRELLPLEVITLPHRATVGDLKREVERHFREIYFSLRSFKAESLMDFNAEDGDLLCQIVNSGSKLMINGRIEEEALIYESGGDERVVYCSCGAKEDDGERMVCCDVCEVWQHTRCAKISNSEEVPKIFLCSRCEHHIMLFPTLL